MAHAEASRKSAHGEKLGGVARGSRSQLMPGNLDPIFGELKDGKLRSDCHWRVSLKHHVGSGLGVGGGCILKAPMRGDGKGVDEEH